MNYMMTDEEAVYMQVNQGHFSQRMADWAISMMKRKDEESGKMKRITPYPIETVEAMLRHWNVEIPEVCVYDAWYLANMVRADYQGSSIEDDEHLVKYIDDTINDPDGVPTMVLACFKAKCNEKGIAIHWERMV